MHHSSSFLMRTVAAAAMLLSALTACAQSGSGSPDAAVSYLINPMHTNAINTPGLNQPIALQWAVDVGGTPSYPLIAEGKVFATVSSYGMDLLVALDAKTGAMVWGPVILPGYPAGIAYDNGRIFYVPQEGTYTSGEMYAYDAGTGAQIWSTPLPGQYLFDSAPTAYNGGVYTVGEGDNGTVYAVNESDGTLLWMTGVSVGESVPAVTTRGVYVSGSCGDNYRLDPQTGRVLWYDTGSCIGGSGANPAIYGAYEFVLASSTYPGPYGQVLATTNGAQVGTFASASLPYSPGFFNNVAYLAYYNQVVAQSTITGDVVWSASGDPNNSFSTPALVANGVVYVGVGYYSYFGPVYLYGFDAKTGDQVFFQDLSSFGYGLLNLAAGQGVLVAPVGHQLLAFSHGVGLTGLTLAASSVTGTLSTTGTVTLNEKAPQGGVTVQLASTIAAATVPATVFIPAGKTSATFPVTTSNVNGYYQGDIQATLGALTLSAPLSVIPIVATALTLSPSEVVGGQTSLATVTVSAPAPAGGLTVTIYSSLAAIAEPATATITIPQGATSGQALIDTADPLVQAIVTITAELNESYASGNLTIDHE